MLRKSLSAKLFVSFLTVIVLSLSMVGFISYFQASSALDRSTERTIAQVIRSASYQTDLYLQNYEKASDSILSYYQVKQFLDMDPEDSYSYYQYTNDIQKYLFRSLFILYPQINLIYVINESGKAVSDDNGNQAYSTQFNAAERYRTLSAQAPESGRIAILNTNVQNVPDAGIISMVRQIRGASSYRPNGILAIEFKAQELARIWEPLDLGQGGFFFILDEFGKPLYQPTGAGQALSAELMANVAAHPNTSYIEGVDGKDYLFVSRKSEYSNWQLVVTMPVSELREPISTIRTTTILVGVLTLAGTLLLATRFGQSVTRPIRVLKDGMRETEKGNWQRLEIDDRQDELGGLMRSYNLMVTRLSQMIERVYEAELTTQKAALELQETRLERQQAEFQALQLQINPHFLYNTLETIKSYAVIQDSDEITEMVEAMAFMLRYSIQTNLQEITIANELRHVLSYMTILKHRIDREFEIDVVIPPGLLLEKTVRLTLQPLIENIFQHAFPGGIEDRHAIRIDARIESGRFLVMVEDNGVGISPERLERLREKLKLNQLAGGEGDSLYHRGGIGLMNVHRRIQMVFGEEYGLSVESRQGEGTRMTLSMPAERRNSQLAERK
ncbi:MAG: integral rane sensor signal transduction histidine kinase [Paenibacillaceae bacterium]|jgi:two-component system sensor histidine kinase YesM|nr:integral rane sensor signal transduction histidine kinase [Paenibacillaceae bacterium]